MPAFSLTPINSFPQTDGDEFPQPLRFSQDDVLFVGPITQVNFVGGTVTEDGNGQLDVTLGGGGSTSPGGLDRQFQWNDDGTFGGTMGLSWRAELITEALIIFQNFSVNSRALNMTPTATTWFTPGESDTIGNWAAIGSRTYSTVSHPPMGGFELDRPGVWVGGQEDPVGTPDGPAFDAWLLSNGIYFQERVDTSKYTWFKPMTRKGSPATPTAFDDAIAVVLDSGNYWLPLILQ